ncbi:hypothetical protein [Spiroplasma citri]|nr:hypothetical protein [Spiroplasma citri]
MVENNIKNTISELINEIKTTTENNLSNLVVRKKLRFYKKYK